MASDFYVKIDGIDGDSNDKSHSKWIEVVSFSHGAVQNVGAGRATDVSGRGAFEPFSFVHLIDKATPKIQQFCMSGQKIAKVQFQVCRAVAGKQEPVYEVTMENVKISKASIKSVVSGSNGAASMIDSFQGADGAYMPLEQVELVAGKITWKYTAIKPDNTKDGAVEATFNQIPCITLNSYTEHIETVKQGTNVLVGEDAGRLREELQRMVGGQWKTSSLPDRWDGRTAERIVQILCN